MIIFIGLAGAGKSVQSQLLADRLGCELLGVGNLLRSKVSDELKQKMLDGHLLKDDNIMELLEKEFKRIGADKNEFILDGSPRTPRQAKWLEDLIESGQLKLSGIIHLKADKQLVRRRLLKRGRPDDKEPAIAERFHEYDQTINLIVDLLRGHGHKVHDVDGEGTIEEVQQRIDVALGI